MLNRNCFSIQKPFLSWPFPVLQFHEYNVLRSTNLVRTVQQIHTHLLTPYAYALSALIRLKQFDALSICVPNAFFIIHKICAFVQTQISLSGVNRQGNVRFGNHLYWVSWQSDDHRLSTANWSWFNARNYCRKRCMDLVSIETPQEYDFIKSLLDPSKISFKHRSNVAHKE